MAGKASTSLLIAGVTCIVAPVAYYSYRLHMIGAIMLQRQGEVQMEDGLLVYRWACLVVGVGLLIAAIVRIPKDEHVYEKGISANRT